MEYKKRVATNGLPVVFGIIASILILFARIIPYSYLPLSLNILSSKYGILYIVTIIYEIFKYAIYPGIFLILLLTGINKPRRGFAFGVVWIVFSSLSIVWTVFELIRILSRISIGSQLFSLINISIIFSFFGSICVLISCIIFNARLSKSPILFSQGIPFQQPFQQPVVNPQMPQQPTNNDTDL